MKFVDNIADYIHSNELVLKDLKIILPSERMKKYLQAALYEKYQKPILAPEIITIDRWVKSHSNRSVIDKTRVLIELFKIQLKDAKTEEDRSFDEFLTWGEILINDFNEIDRYLLDSKQIFRNLADIKEIENWSFEKEELSEAQKRFMEFWDRLPGYYEALNKALDKDNQTYSGGAAKWLSNNIELTYKENESQRFLFAGFNALSPAELALIKQLEVMGKAHVLIDADNYYLKNNRHEAGMFLRGTLAELGKKQLPFVQNDLESKKINVQLIECAQNTGQVKVMTTLLAKLKQEELSETLLLLADESLINSVVRNLPAEIKKANITLGMPIKNSAIKSWVEVVFSIQENKKRFNTKAVYFADLQKLWNHPFVLAMLGEDEQHKIQRADEAIVQRNRIFINSKNLDVGPVMRTILDRVTIDWEANWKVAIDTIRSLNRSIYKELNKSYSFERAIIECFDAGLRDFDNIVNEKEGLPEMSLRSFKHLFNQSWHTRSIAYHGNPIDGLQIMGLLETRGLDFKRIICLGMNEGNLPPTNPIQTMIPMDLRRFHKLPTPREKQGIFAHHFYRLLHHVEDLTITYSTAEESIGFNEPSRYVLQMEKELSRLNQNVEINHSIYALELAQKKMLVEITKTPEILDRLDGLFASSTSASMVKKFIACPLDFYYRYVMDFGEEENVEEEIEHSTFGTFIHNTLEELYTPFARFDKEGEEVKPAPKNITSIDVERMLKDFEVALNGQFMKHFNNDKEAFTKGKNYLAYQMAKELTARFLKSEIQFLSQQTEPVFIEALERSYEHEVEIDVSGHLKKVKLRGYIDRIDRIGENNIRIIDYKSGKVDAKDVELSTRGALEDVVMSGLKSKKHVLQLIQYAYLYYKQHGVIPQSSIISFVSNEQKPFVLKPGKFDMEEIIKDYPSFLGAILEEVYDETIPFEHTIKGWGSYCKYCD